MKPVRLLAILAFCPLIAHADNYATCILDKVSGAQDEPAVTAAYQSCRQAFPAGLGEVNQGAGQEFFSSYVNGAECIRDKTAGTTSRRGAMLIGAACRRLYDGSSGPWTAADVGAADSQ
ncbi:MAG TPA: hypothetical protein VN361_07110 [Oxalicibacterium sp.]|nr:hypothetical protein [Oxalicibacterium sp.]